MFGKLGMPVPSWLVYLRENKMMMFAGFMIIGQVSGQLVSTGAFEIELDGRVVFSKLKLGRMPDTNDIITAFSSL